MSPEAPTYQESDLTLWDVVQEHLDEASFLWSQWESALVSPSYRVDEIARTVESRLLAHLDGLVVGGRPVAEKILIPSLDEEDPGVVFACAYALVDCGDPAYVEWVYNRLAEATGPQLAAVQRALELAALAQYEGLQRMLSTTTGAQRAATLDVLSFHRVEVGPVLGEILREADPLVLPAAFRAAGRLAAHSHGALLSHILATGAELSPFALSAAMILDLPEAMSLCRQSAKQHHAAGDMARLLLSLVGDHDDWELLRQATEDPALQKSALFALGYSGSVPLVELILGLMREPSLAALAGEALMGITGVDIEAEKLAAKRPADEAAAASKDEDEDETEGEPEPEDLADLDADLSQKPEQELPVPDPELAAAWWQKKQASFQPQLRYLHGLPFEGEKTLVEALSRAPMRRRHALALELAIRTQGRTQIETRSLRQQQLSSRVRSRSSEE